MHAARKTFQAKIPRSPNHSKNPLTSSPNGVRRGIRRSASGGRYSGEANPRPVTGGIPAEQKVRDSVKAKWWRSTSATVMVGDYPRLKHTSRSFRLRCRCERKRPYRVRSRQLDYPASGASKLFAISNFRDGLAPNKYQVLNSVYLRSSSVSLDRGPDLRTPSKLRMRFLCPIFSAGRRPQ